MSSERVIRTGCGPLRGLQSESGVLSFLGIPYAESPAGEARFQPPVPVEAWTLPRDARGYGSTAPQPVVVGPLASLLPHLEIPGPDYLNLNVWTSDLDGSLPVMVFIHGGSFTSGSGSLGVYDGANFARDGVVLVTFNYRLGADGFLWFGDGPVNLGLLDQVAALRWVREHIADFGGDPENVTIFGESSGAMSACTLATMPVARGLFRRLIAQSGAASCVLSPSVAIRVAHRMSEILNVAPDRQSVGQVSQSALLQAQAQVALEVVSAPEPEVWGGLARTIMPFEPIVDGTIVPGDPQVVMREGESGDVEMLIGWNSDEGNLFFIPADRESRVEDATLEHLARARAYPSGVIDHYRRAYPTWSPAQLAARMMTDGFYVTPALEVANSHAQSWVYNFTWASPALDAQMGSCHALELPFAFDNLRGSGYGPVLGSNPPRDLAASMHRAWIDFATYGDPGWEPYRQERPFVKRFGDGSATVIESNPDLAMWHDYL